MDQPTDGKGRDPGFRSTGAPIFDAFALPGRVVKADHDGQGPIQFRRVYDHDDLVGIADFVDATVVPPGSSIGEHGHERSLEIYYVVRGSGTQVTGPLAANATRQEESTTIGPGFSSTSPISGGRATRLGPGEMQIIPPGVGHVWTDIAEGGIDYMVIRVDPEHVLAASK